jgi:hypothetical protein
MQSKPRNRSEAAKFARVYEILSPVWRGEWLFNFRKYRDLSAGDLADWENWVNTDFSTKLSNFVCSTRTAKTPLVIFLQLRLKFRDNKPLFSQLIGHTNKLRTKSGS